MEWLILIAAFLIGALPFGYFVPKLLRGVDIRTIGSRNPGFTNVYRAVGTGPGLVVLLADIGKGIVAVLLARAVGGGAIPVLAGIAAIAGHVWTPFLGFRGGKGVATAAGVFATLVPAATFICLGLFVLVVGLSRYISLGSVVAAVCLPIAVVVLARIRSAPVPGYELGIAVLVALLIVVRHRENLRRLFAGEENRFSFHRSGGDR